MRTTDKKATKASYGHRKNRTCSQLACITLFFVNQLGGLILPPIGKATKIANGWIFFIANFYELLERECWTKIERVWIMNCCSQATYFYRFHFNNVLLIDEYCDTELCDIISIVNVSINCVPHLLKLSKCNRSPAGTRRLAKRFWIPHKSSSVPVAKSGNQHVDCRKSIFVRRKVQILKNGSFSLIKTEFPLFVLVFLIFFEFALVCLVTEIIIH